MRRGYLTAKSWAIRAEGGHRCPRCQSWRLPEEFAPIPGPYRWAKTPKTCITCRESERESHHRRALSRPSRVCARPDCRCRFHPLKASHRYCSHRCAMIVLRKGGPAPALRRRCQACLQIVTGDTCPRCGKAVAA